MSTDACETFRIINDARGLGKEPFKLGPPLVLQVEKTETFLFKDRKKSALRHIIN